jgi:hypothetical protein
MLSCLVLIGLKNLCYPGWTASKNIVARPARRIAVSCESGEVLIKTRIGTAESFRAGTKGRGDIDAFSMDLVHLKSQSKTRRLADWNSYFEVCRSLSSRPT